MEKYSLQDKSWDYSSKRDRDDFQTLTPLLQNKCNYDERDRKQERERGREKRERCVPDPFLKKNKMSSINFNTNNRV